MLLFLALLFMEKLKPRQREGHIFVHVLQENVYLVANHLGDLWLGDLCDGHVICFNVYLTCFLVRVVRLSSRGDKKKHKVISLLYI